MFEDAPAPEVFPDENGNGCQETILTCPLFQGGFALELIPAIFLANCSQGIFLYSFKNVFLKCSISTY